VWKKVIRMTTGATIKAKRIQAGIAGHVLCRELGNYARSRLSGVENEVLTVRPEELARIDDALNGLIQAKGILRQIAEDLGWPGVYRVA
jgi:hypothetical protein